jgi:hypothetical protein
MRLKLIISLHKTLLITIVCLPLVVFSNTSFGQNRKIDTLYLELDKKYRIPEQWSALPLDLEDPYKRVKNGPPLVNVVHKANVEWLSRWIANPKKNCAECKDAESWFGF